MNRVQEAYYAAERSRRDFKQLVQHYDGLTTQQIRLKQKIKARLRTQGVIIRGQQLFTSKGRVEVLSKVASHELRESILQLYELLDQTLATHLAAQKLMLRTASSFPEVELFKAVPGMGPKSTYDKTHARLSVQRNIVSVLRAMWISMTPYRDELG